VQQIGTPEQVLADIRIKEERARSLLEREELDALVIGRQDNFAWLTAGGDNHVVLSSELGAGYAVLTRDRKWLVTHRMDRQRFEDEFAAGQDFQVVSLYWYQGSPLDKVLELTRGLRVGADFALPGARLLGAELVDLHYPLTELELERYCWIGSRVNQILLRVATELQPGMTEQEIAARLLYDYALAGFTIDVLLVGVDDRVARYRHPIPTDRALECYALLHPAARRWGLHANVTRLVHFGEPPGQLRRAVEAVQAIGAAVATLLAPGVRFAQVLEEQIRVYRKSGFGDEWHNHFQGGITGYLLGDPARCQNQEARAVLGQAYDYFITVPGAKFEELMLLTQQGVEISSLGPGWPIRSVPTARGEIEIPDILIR